MKKIVKRLAATMLIAALIIPALATGTALYETPTVISAAVSSSESREEVVYANLSSDGAPKEITVVTILHNPEASAVTDYGSYISVTNLTDTTPITLTDDAVAISAPKGDLYYQGLLNSTDLPWNISITYFLDGIERPASDLAGKNGHIEIKVKTTPNTGIDSSYFDNYLLQISMTLDASRCTNISALGGTLANAGKNKLITYAVMPGKTGDISLDADVTDFSMEGIDLAAVPLSMKFEAPDTSSMIGDLTKLSDAVAALNDGIAQLKSGSSDLKNGALDLKSGSSLFAGGLNDLSAGSTDLIGGSVQIKDALFTISSSMNGSAASDQTGDMNLSALSQLPDGLSQLAAGLDGVSAGLSDLNAGFTTAYAALNATLLEIPDDIISEDVLAKLYQDNPDKKDTIDTLAQFYASGSKAKGTFLATKPAFDAVGNSLEQLVGSVNSISDALKLTASQIKDAIDNNNTLAQMAQLSAGLTALSDNYSQFHKGLISYTSGVSELRDNYGALDNGISGIAGGMGDLYGGISETNDGTTKLNNELKDMPSKVDEQINNLLNEYDKSDFKTTSFVSAKNVNTDLVQFVFKTDKVEKAEAPAEAPVQPEVPSIWTRFLDLFK